TLFRSRRWIGGHGAPFECPGVSGATANGPSRSKARSFYREDGRAGTRVTTLAPVAPGDRLDDLDESFSRVAVALFAPGTVAGTLRGIVGQAAATVDGCDHAGVLVVADDGTARTVAATSPLVAEI